MAVVASPQDTKMRLVLQTGFDSENKPLLKIRTYNRIKSEATDEDVYQFGSIIIGLQKHSLYAFNRVNEVELEEV